MHGTNDGGLNRYDPRTGQFTAFLHDPQNENSLSENSVVAVDVDLSGIVWAGPAISASTGWIRARAR